MADVRTDNGSSERVALELAQWIAEQCRGSETFQTRVSLLDLYGECLYATRSLRTYQRAT